MSGNRKSSKRINFEWETNKKRREKVESGRAINSKVLDENLQKTEEEKL